MSKILKIALLGYGKMGQAIEQLALDQGHQICFKATASTQNYAPLATADVAIEFSHPECGYGNVVRCLELGIPVVSGTTGWMVNMEQAQEICKKKNGAFFYASNFSVGVNIFFAINEKLSQLMSRFAEYQPEMLEVHHTHKKDAPSGTAITLAQGILNHHASFNQWTLDTQSANPQAVAIHVERKDPTPGTHKISWHSVIDSIEIQHIAHSRIGFATGALMAAEWLIDKKGNFTMQDLLQL